MNIEAERIKSEEKEEELRIRSVELYESNKDEAPWGDNVKSLVSLAYVERRGVNVFPNIPDVGPVLSSFSSSVIASLSSRSLRIRAI